MLLPVQVIINNFTNVIANLNYLMHNELRKHFKNSLFLKKKLRNTLEHYNNYLITSKMKYLLKQLFKAEMLKIVYCSCLIDKSTLNISILLIRQVIEG